MTLSVLPSFTAIKSKKYEKILQNRDRHCRPTIASGVRWGDLQKRHEDT